MPPHVRPQITVDTGLLLSDAGVLDWQTAQICGVAVKTVRRWRRLYQRRGVARAGTAPMPACFVCDDGPLDAGAYAYLFASANVNADAPTVRHNLTRPDTSFPASLARLKARAG